MLGQILSLTAHLSFNYTDTVSMSTIDATSSSVGGSYTAAPRMEGSVGAGCRRQTATSASDSHDQSRHSTSCCIPVSSLPGILKDAVVTSPGERARLMTPAAKADWSRQVSRWHVQ